MTTALVLIGSQNDYSNAVGWSLSAVMRLS